MASVIQLKVFLTRKNRQEDPGIDRRLLILDNINFYDLHCILQISFGWCGVGLHEFRDFFDQEDLICNDYDAENGSHGMIYHSQLYNIKGYLKPNALIT
ncbi:MAG: plasmid pRiA4b ORF-3 family protein [Cytophagaceae bacterium]|nr:plasmid pRiA4b ORF-3 family protein [Cytophagaceae bacterium]